MKPPTTPPTIQGITPSAPPRITWLQTQLAGTTTSNSRKADLLMVPSTVIASPAETWPGRPNCSRILVLSAGLFDFIFVSLPRVPAPNIARRSEEHTSELQSRSDLVCRLLLEKKKNDIDCAS